MTAGEKVAFSASLSFKEANYGYSNSPLPYKRIFTNVGNAYDSIRGNRKKQICIMYFCFQLT